MSQHDYTIANNTGAAVRTDINDALTAIATMNSGSGTPATTYKHQWFINESTGIVYRRNQGNTTSVPMARVAGSLLSTLTANTTLTANDAAKTIIMGGGCNTLTLPSPSVAGAEWFVDVVAQSLTVQQQIVSPSGSINGFGTTIYQPFGTSVRLISTGSAWVCLGDFLRGGYWAGTISSATITAENTDTQLGLALSGTATIPATVSSNKWTCPASGVWDISANLFGNFTAAATNYGEVTVGIKINAAISASDTKSYPTPSFTIGAKINIDLIGMPLKSGDLVEFYARKYSGTTANGLETPAGTVRFALR